MARPRQQNSGSTKFSVLLVLGLAIACLGLAAGCTGKLASSTDAAQTTEEAASSSHSPQASKPAGDSALPALEGDYAYVMATVVAKDADAGSITVTALPWETEAPFKKSPIAEGQTGSVLCSELPFFPGGIQIGTVVVVSCLGSDADAFPITAYSIEKQPWFEDRVARWLGA